MNEEVRDRFAMEAQKIREALYADYTSLTVTLATADSDLCKMRKDENEAAKSLKDARRVYEEVEAHLLAGNEEANGKNAEERKVNTTMLIARERKQGKALYIAWTNLLKAENALADAQTNKEIAIDHLSAVRNVGHMIAGLGHAFGA